MGGPLCHPLQDGASRSVQTPCLTYHGILGTGVLQHPLHGCSLSISALFAGAYPQQQQQQLICYQYITSASSMHQDTTPVGGYNLATLFLISKRLFDDAIMQPDYIGYA